MWKIVQQQTINIYIYTREITVNGWEELFNSPEGKNIYICILTYVHMHVCYVNEYQCKCSPLNCRETRLQLYKHSQT